MQDNSAQPHLHETDEVIKQKHRNLAHEKLAFLPAALEIQAAPPPKWSRSLLWAICSLIFIVILWASWAEIDIIATAQGKIVPSGQVKIIQPLEAGVVKNIFIKEGQHVKAGRQISQADADRLESEWLGYTEDLALQKAFLAKLDSAVKSAKSSDIPLLLPVNQRLLFESVWHEYQSKLNSFTSEINKLTAEKKSIEIDVGRIEKTLPLVIEREQSYFTLLETSAVSRNQYLELKQQRIDQEETLLLQRAKVEQINASIESAQQNLQAYLSESRRNTLQEINQLTRQSESINQELTKAKRLTQLRVLTSPVDGVVEELVIATIGGVVTPAQELLHIVPSYSSGGEHGSHRLEIDAGLLNKDIGFVHTGQIAEIKIDSFPFTKYGVFDGEVTDISADAIEHEQLGLLFPLKASLATDEINVDGKWVKLKPGMSVTVEIKTGTRRLMEFLLAPLMRGVSEGARER